MARAGSYDNLITIVTVLLVFSSVGFAVQMAERYRNESTNAFDVSSMVSGYVKPGSRQQMAKPRSVNQRSNSSAKGLKMRFATKEELRRFNNYYNRAAVLLHAKQYEYAIKALDKVIQMQPQMPDAYVNIGIAYLGLEQYDTALSAFAKAIDLKPDQANAYWGMAHVFEHRKDLEGALGAMRTFIHLSDQNNAYLARARSALWEWEAQLGRIPGVVEAPPGTQSPLTVKSTPHKSATKPANH